MTFYKCKECDQVFTRLVSQNKEMVCCDSVIEELVVNTNEEDAQQHKPNIRKIGNFITITLEENHPMVDIHHIEFICLETNQGFQFKHLPLDKQPKVQFVLGNEEEIINVYLYCNLHSLWSLYQ